LLPMMIWRPPFALCAMPKTTSCSGSIQYTEKLEPHKSHQGIKELALVHKLAKKVFIWLGDEDQSRAKAHLSAVWTLINLVKQDAPEALDGLFSMPTFVNCLGLTFNTRTWITLTFNMKT
jgi:hypothetical protein